MDALRGISQAINNAAASNDSETFTRVASELVNSKNRVREEFQALTADKIKAIIQKLEKNQPLDADEKECVKLWVVGDAEGYIKMEESLQEWLADFRELAGIIKDYETKPASPQDLVDVHGVLEDAVKIASAISHFLDDRDRVARFQKAINNLDAADSKLIADILRESLLSPDM
jgi:hypothetical protein